MAQAPSIRGGRLIAAEEQKDKIEHIAEDYRAVRQSLYDDLLAEFGDDLQEWGAELMAEDLSIRFTPPWILFKNGESDITPDFEGVLRDFVPRYIGLLHDARYREHVVEVRIEGHTSSVWKSGVAAKRAYIRNMALSQERTRAVLELSMNLPPVAAVWESWLKARLTANGLSSSRLVLKPNGTEDETRSRRVEFRVVTDADKELREILELADGKGPHAPP